jgi:hypothetical protein
VFCAAQGLGCVDAWDDIVDETCSESAERVGCSHIWDGDSLNSDVICMCGLLGKVFISYCHHIYYSPLLLYSAIFWPYKLLFLSSKMKLLIVSYCKESTRELFVKNYTRLNLLNYAVV